MLMAAICGEVAQRNFLTSSQTLLSLFGPVAVLFKNLI
jgi:hypothetical protein